MRKFMIVNEMGETQRQMWPISRQDFATHFEIDKIMKISTTSPSFRTN
jgi:hypothetical protein